MASVRHVKVTLKRAKNINACTVRNSKTMVFATASYKDLLYTTNRVEGMGQNPAWENDGTNVFHFDVEDGHITVEFFNRNKVSIGASKLPIAELGHLVPGQSEVMTLPVTERQRQFGELVLKVEIMAQQAMGELGFVMVKIRKGNIPNLTSFISRTTTIGAKLIYNHNTQKSGVLENMGNRFEWHEDNTFTFIINSLKPDDVLKIEVYNKQYKVGECAIFMSLIIEQEVNRQECLSLPNRGSVGNIEVTACFTPKPVTPPQQIHRSSYSPTQQHPSGIPYHPSTSTPYYPPPHTGVHSSVVYPPQAVRQSQSFNHRPSAPSAESLYPPVPGHVYLNPSVSLNPRAPVLQPEVYPPPGPHVHHHGLWPLHTAVSDPTSSYSPSAPAYNAEVVNHHSRGSSDTVLGYQHAHGAPGGREQVQSVYTPPEFDEEMKRFVGVFIP